MDDQRFGAAIRALRKRRRLSQRQLAGLGNVSQTTVSRVQRGHVGSLSLTMVRELVAQLDVRLDLDPRWRSGDLERLLNARHSALHEAVAMHLSAFPGWVFRPEVSFSIYGKRGVIDILAFHERRLALVVIELKTRIVDVNELVGVMDRRERLSTQIAARFGWQAETVSVWVIVLADRTNRRRIEMHRSMLRAAFPQDGRAMEGWLRNPRGSVRALSFWRSRSPRVGRASAGGRPPQVGH
jgi:transcriptional regulator with XRE-family HTH domain